MKPSGRCYMSDPWVWRVEFDDGSTLDEYDADAPDGRGWANVQEYAREPVRTLVRALLIPTRDGLPTHVVTRKRDGDASVVILRRRRVLVSAETGEQMGAHDPITIALCGGVYTFFFTDGSVVVSDDLNAV